MPWGQTWGKNYKRTILPKVWYWGITIFETQVSSQVSETHEMTLSSKEAPARNFLLQFLVIYSMHGKLSLRLHEIKCYYSLIDKLGTVRNGFDKLLLEDLILPLTFVLSIFHKLTASWNGITAVNCFVAQ